MTEVTVYSENPRFNGISFSMIVSKNESDKFLCLERWWTINDVKTVFDLSKHIDLRDELILLYHLTGLGPVQLKIESSGTFTHSNLYSLLYDLRLPEHIGFIRYGTCLCGIKNCDTVTTIDLQPKVCSYGELFRIWGIPDFELQIHFYHQPFSSVLQVHKLEGELEPCYKDCTTPDPIPVSINLDPKQTYFYYYFMLLGPDNSDSIQFC